MTPPMLRQLRHDVWASEQLVKSLKPEQLDLSVQGTYGTIRRTLAHIVAADENYVVRLLGALLHDQRFSPSDTVTLDEVAKHLGHVKDGVERLFASGEFDPDRLIRDTPLRRSGDPRFEMNAWVPLTQFVHHGSDHRAQIATTLSQHGIEPPDLQVWPLAMEMGASREVK